MTDVTFKFGNVPGRYIDKVQRIAVLYPLRDVAAHTEDVLRKTQEVVEQWRARVGSLTELGWLSQGKKAHTTTYLRNCTPAFVMAYPLTRPCGLKSICPSCYARWVRKIWERLDAELMPAEDTGVATRETRGLTIPRTASQPPVRRRVTGQFHLIERRHTFYRPVIDEQAPDMTVEQYLAILLRNIQQQRSETVQLVDPVGAFLYTTIEPVRRGTAWKIQHRQLFKLTPDQVFPEKLVTGVNGHVNRHDLQTIDRDDLVQIIGRICHYPTKLMTGDPLRVLQLLYVRGYVKFRSNESFRSFRNSFDSGS